MEKRRYVTPEEAEKLLPDKENIHTFYNMPFGLLGADWDRQEVVEKFKKSDKIEIAGPCARNIGHGLAVYNDNIKWQSEVLFIETDKEKLDIFDPKESEV